MARSLEALQKQYNSGSKNESLRGGPGGGPPRGRMAKGKPKELKKTVKRILSYVGAYKYRLILVFVCMLLTTVATLCAGYMIAPIITRITRIVSPETELKNSALSFAGRKLCS